MRIFLPASTSLLRPKAREAFTLIEVLVSMAVLAVVIILVAQLMTSTQGVVGANNKRMDADAEARLIFDRLAIDFSQMLRRDDVDFVVANVSGSDTIYFFSQSPGYLDSSVTTESINPVSLIGYRVSETNSITGENDFHLQRFSRGLVWEKNGAKDSVVFLTYPPTQPGATASPTPFPSSTIPTAFSNVLQGYPFNSGTSDDYHTVGQQVFRFEVTLLAKNTVTDRNSGRVIANAGQFFQLAKDESIRLTDVSAIVVSLGILDGTSRKIVKNFAPLASALKDPSASELAATPPTLPAGVWQSKIDSGQFAGAAGIPAAAAAQVRIYERIFYLN